MKVGFFTFATPDTATPACMARQAEALGFESFWLPEHSDCAHPLRTPATPWPKTA